MNSIDNPTTELRGNLAGWLLAVVSLLALALMTHHPSVSAPTIGAALTEIGEEGALSGFVHGALILMLVVQWYALTLFSCRIGVVRGPVIGALIGHGTGVLAMIGAALISGFVTSDLASWLLEHDVPDVSRTLLALLHMGNQRLAQVGVIGMAAATLLWSTALLSRQGAARWIGGLGLLLGAALVVGMVAGLIHLDVHGMTAVVAAQLVWYLAVATLLIRGRV